MTKDNTPENPDTIELLSFRVGNEDYAIYIGCVREVRRWTTPASLPFESDFVLGVINLRGEVVPLLDLSARLRLPRDSGKDRNVTIIGNFEDTTTGLVVEAVSDIIAPSEQDMKPPPEMPLSGGNSYVQS